MVCAIFESISKDIIKVREDAVKAQYQTFVQESITSSEGEKMVTEFGK
jgi:hypothetical protein